jgi:hypothetical protein
MPDATADATIVAIGSSYGLVRHSHTYLHPVMRQAAKERDQAFGH